MKSARVQRARPLTAVLFSFTTLVFFVNPLSAATIDLNGYRFDPLITEPAIPSELAAPRSDQPALYLVQLTGPVEEIWKEGLLSLGVSLHGYVPESTFIVRMDAVTRDRVGELPFVSWVGSYETAYRISPEIGRAEFRDPARRDDPLVTLRVRVAGDLDATVETASRIGRILDQFENPNDSGFVIRCEPDRLTTLASLTNILYVEERPETFLLNNTTRWVVQTNQSASTTIWDAGIYGEGQLLCMMDSGLDYNSCWFRELGNAPPGPGHRKVIDYQEWGGGNAYDGCGTGHGTHVAGTAVGDQSYINSGNTDYNGMAYQAKVMVQDVGGDGWLECLFGLISVPSSLTAAFNDAYGVGARMHTNSWGSTSNSYDGYCVNIDSFMWNQKDFLVLFANGNSGPGGGTVGSPATAKNCVSVGATKQSPNQETIASYSGRGPTSDGRLKPTVTAPGGESPVYINSANNHDGNPPSATCTVQGNPFQGTSMATPAVAGCALLIRDYLAQGFYPAGNAGGDPILPSAALVKAILVNGGRDMGSANQPDNNEGWGRILLEDVLYFDGQTRELRLEDESAGLATGEEIAYIYRIDGATEPLEITLVWTDYPASQGANPALVNNLDLTVTSPSGNVYRGNVYSGGESTTGGASDTRNVEECVRRSTPEVGDWTIRVRAANVPQGGRQPFALVATGSFGNWPEDPAGIEDSDPLRRLALAPARPNPFSGTTTLAFTLPHAGRAKLAVYDLQGRLIAAIVDAELPAGAHRHEWDGRGPNQELAANGIYFYRLETERGAITRKVALLH